MIAVRFRIVCKPEKATEVRAALTAVVEPSRKLEGVLSFDIGQDITDSNSFIATEIFSDTAALDRQESLPEVHKVLALLPDSVVSDPEATVYEISAAK